MKEQVIHEWWKHKNIDFRALQQIDDTVEIVDFGEYNAFENGPDFIGAKVKIGDLLWCGNVEIHVKSSDWDKHGHQFDSHYDNVILHVVHENDKEVYNSKNETIKTVEIVPYQRNDHVKNQWIPCEKLLHTCHPLTIVNELENSLIDRLNRKISLIHTQQVIYEYDYQAIFDLLFFKSFGNKSNTWFFEQLFVLSYPYLTKADKREEALLFGLSGLDIPYEIEEEWEHLKTKYVLSDIPKIKWKTKGFYAKASPRDRLLQLVKGYRLMKGIDVYQMTITDWLHVKEMLVSGKIMSSPQIDLLFINGVVLFYWWFAEETGRYEFKDRAIDLLIHLPPEKNTIIQKWKSLGIKPKNAFDTQALLELKNQKCTFTKCLECKIGKELL